jgi:hypothetical protein
MSRYWLNPKPADPQELQNQVGAVCATYLNAPGLETEGTHVISSDEKTGMQALERTAPTKPARPGQVERRELEYERHGTLCLTASFNVATGKVVSPTLQETRRKHAGNTQETRRKHAGNTQRARLRCQRSAGDRHGSRRWLDLCPRQSQHALLGVVGAARREELRHPDRPRRQGQAWRSGDDGEPCSLSFGSDAPDSLRLHPQALLMAESGGDLVVAFWCDDC